MSSPITSCAFRPGHTHAQTLIHIHTHATRWRQDLFSPVFAELNPRRSLCRFTTTTSKSSPGARYWYAALRAGPIRPPTCSSSTHRRPSTRRATRTTCWSKARRRVASRVSPRCGRWRRPDPRSVSQTTGIPRCSRCAKILFPFRLSGQPIRTESYRGLICVLSSFQLIYRVCETLTLCADREAACEL